MLSDNGLQVDYEALHDVLDRADVLTVGFATFPERLLVDTRTAEGTGPLVAIVEPVATVQERYLWLGRHRGMFGAPRGFSFFIWPHTVRALVEQDALARLRARLAAVSETAPSELDAELRELLGAERRAMRAAVEGDPPWRALWERRA